MYCNKINRECNYYNICNGDKKASLDGKNYIDILNPTYIHKVLFFLKIKKVIKVERLDLDEFKYIFDSLKKELNVKMAISSVIEDESFKDKNTKEGYINILVGDNNKNLKKFIYFDNSSNYIERVTGTGLLLGYPKYCIKNAITMSSSILKLKQFEAWEETFFLNGITCPLLSNINKLYVHYPCSIGCKDTIENSEKVLEYLEKSIGKGIVEYYFNNNK